jgi:hypothetical protein
MQSSKAGHPSFILISSRLDPRLLNLFSATKFGQYAPPQMLKFTSETSSAKMAVGVAWALFPEPWHINS